VSAPSSSSDGDDGDDADTPSTREVARVLDVDGEQLRHFVDYHPEPTAPSIMGAFDVAPDEKELVAAWLDGVEAGSRPGGER
jgi:hypothetical protein